MTSGDGPLTAPADVPAWLQPLAAAVAGRSADELSATPLPAGGGRRSAVLILFGEDERGPNVLITERAATLAAHPGQPSFPGGRIDPGDDGVVGAALREAEEETGLDPAGVEVVAVLTELFLPVNSSVVTPVIGWWRAPSPVRVVDPGEVASVHVVAVADLVDPANRVSTGFPGRWIGPGFVVSGLLVWGFTAGLLDRVLRLGGFEQPWDVDRVVPLPERTVALAARDRSAAEVTRARLTTADEPADGRRP